jgi:cortactin
MAQLRENARKNEELMKIKTLEAMPKPSEGYGGKFGVLTDRKDKCAEDWSYQGKVDQHYSQTDHKKGFGGQFGVDQTPKDKSAFGWDEKESLSKHASQKGI